MRQSVLGLCGLVLGMVPVVAAAQERPAGFVDGDPLSAMTMNAQFDWVAGKLASANGLIETLASDLEEAAGRLTQVEAAQAAQGTQIADLNTGLGGLTDRVGAVEGTQAAHTTQIADLATSLEGLDTAHEADDADLRAQIAQLAADLAAERARVDALEQATFQAGEILVAPAGSGVEADAANLEEALALIRGRRLAGPVAIRLTPGTYTHTGASAISLNHPDGALLSIIGDGQSPAEVVLRFTSPGQVDGGLRLAGGTLARLSNLTIDGADPDEGGRVGFGLAIWTGATADVRNVVVRNTAGVGVSVYGGSLVTLADVRIEAAGVTCLSMLGNSIVELETNSPLQILNCGGSGIAIGQGGFLNADSAQAEVRGAMADGISVWGHSGVIFSRGRIIGSEDNGITISASSYGTFSGTAIEGSGLYGIDIRTNSLASFDQGLIINNASGAVLDQTQP